ncbi:MAG: endospore germination permease [Clostridia bacterium]
MREDISLKQGFSLLFIFLSGGIMAIGGGSEAGRDSYLSALCSVFFIIPLYYVYYNPLKVHKTKNYFEIIDLLYSEKFGNIINFVTAIAIFLVALVSFSRFTLFIKTVALQNTSVYIIGIFMAFTCIFATYNGFETLGRFCEIMIVAIIFFLLAFVVVSIPLFKAENLQPFMENGVKPLVSGMYSISATPFMEGFALVVLVSQSRKRDDMQKVVFVAGITSAITMSVIFLRNLLILGYPAIESLYYPSYLAMSLVSLGEFFERQEVAVSIIFLIADIVKITSISIFLCKMINYKFKTQEYKFYAPAVIIMIFAFSITFFEDTMQLFSFFSIYKYILTFPLAVIPICTFILCKIKTKAVIRK